MKTRWGFGMENCSKISCKRLRWAFTLFLTPSPAPTCGRNVDFAQILGASFGVKTVGSQPLGRRFARFVKATSFDAFEPIVERVGIAIASAKLKFLAFLFLPVEMPPVQLRIRGKIIWMRRLLRQRLSSCMGWTKKSVSLTVHLFYCWCLLLLYSGTKHQQ